MKTISTIIIFITILTAADRDSTLVFPLLPPLRVIQDAAVQHSPLLKRESESVKMRRQDLSITKTNWLKGLTVEASSQYGSYGDQSVNKLYLGNRVGASIKISLDDILSLGSRTEKDEAAIASAEYNQQNLERELRQIVAQQYVKIQTSLTLVQICAQGYHNAVTNQQNAESKFRSGEIALYDYSRILDLVTSSSLTLERTRGELRQDWTVLEEAIGVSIESLRGAE
ncbi:MAG: TolC family protein [Bacteroidota bacterium]